MALVDVYDAATADSTLKHRAIGAALAAQASIRVEDVATPNHTNRVTWSDALIASPLVVGGILWAQLLENATIIDAVLNGTIITDAQVQTAVDATVDLVATG